MGRRPREQQGLWVASSELPQSPGHPFYRKLNELLAEADFDRQVESWCRPYYAAGVGRPSIPPGVYFRMLLVGYFEGLDSQRGIAWRCSDSLSVRAFLGLELTAATPEHSSLTVIRQRLPQELHERVFQLVLQVAQHKKLLGGETLAIDATYLEANAALKAIVRKDSGDDYKTFLKKLAAEAGLENPSDEELRRFDQQRKHKTLSNDEWQSPTDPDSRIAQMKDGRTHLAYKAEHAVDLHSNLVVAATVYPADVGDPETLQESLPHARRNLERSGSWVRVREVVADRGYHKAETLTDLWLDGVRTYIPERRQRHRRRWVNKPPLWEYVVGQNRRRVRGPRGKRLSRKRSEYVERTFAHVCETGGGRRSWLRGLVDVTKRYLVQVAAHNLGILMRKLFGIGTPRTLQGEGGWFVSIATVVYWWAALWTGRCSDRRSATVIPTAA
jgi:transposase